MFSRWSIRTKLIFGIGLLLATVVALSISSFVNVYAYRGLAKSISLRAPELPLTAELAQHVSRLGTTYELLGRTPDWTETFTDEASPVAKLLGPDFRLHLYNVRTTFQRYRSLLEQNQASDHYRQIGDQHDELQVVNKYDRTLQELAAIEEHIQWSKMDSFQYKELGDSLKVLNELTTELPSHLHQRMRNFADEVRGKYRFGIGLTISTGVFSSCLLMLSIRLFYNWLFRPLRVLVHGSRRVASGDFQHRIQLHSLDEMAELADAMNNMTQRFQEIRDDLDQQVRQRTKEVVRSEQLASVGFLAAGVAHEINNPLASIALCAESLEERMSVVQSGEDDAPQAEFPADEMDVLRTYLRMIQDEAFRCKDITERLLDFSRLGEVEKQNTDLTELTQGVIDMVRHLGKYQEKRIVFRAADDLQQESVFAPVNPQEMKQVVLNLLTNALDSLEPGGVVNVSLGRQAAYARLVVQDDGCGMTEEVQKHLFEPFFTRRRGGQGTGLGMSITYRILSDHGGHIAVHSDGPGRGSRFTITLPLNNHDEELHTFRSAA